MVDNNNLAHANDKELDSIRRGLYQEQFYSFTYDLPSNIEERSPVPLGPIEKTVGAFQDFARYVVCPIMDQPGLRCTAAISAEDSPGPIEIQINFFGTIDFASKLADLETGGPGQQTLERHEAQLLKQVDTLLESMSASYPDKSFRIRLAGHSLGGALAKGFAHSIQRACAIQESTPEAIIMKIKKDTSIKSTVSDSVFRCLEKKLEADKDKFRGLNSLSKLEGITVYALGAQGVSKTTDINASLLTYYYQDDFMNVYNHYHRLDIIPKFGDTEFLAGKNGVIPRISVNKSVEYYVDISESEVKHFNPLPFPGITSRVMAAHNKRIYNCDEYVQSKVVELTESKHMLEKFSFSAFKQILYKAAFFIAKLLSHFKLMRNSITMLKSYPSSDIEEPKNISYLLRNVVTKAPNQTTESIKKCLYENFLVKKGQPRSLQTTKAALGMTFLCSASTLTKNDLLVNGYSNQESQPSYSLSLSRSAG